MDPSHRSRMVAVAALALILSSCSEPERTHRFQMQTAEGIVTAVTTGGPRWEGELFSYEMERELVQDPEVPASLLSGRGGSVTMDAAGNHYVVDSGSCRILVYDREGIYTRSFGGRGEGPGEFRSLSLQAHHGGVLQLWDAARALTTLYAEEGTLLETIHAPDRRVQAQYRLAGGRLLRTSLHSRGAGRADRDYVRDRMRAAVTDASGDTLAFFQTDEVIWGYNFADGRGSLFMFYGGSPIIRYLPGPDRVLLATGVDGEVRFCDLAGELRRLVRLDLPRTPVGPEGRRRIRDWVAEQAALAPQSPILRAQQDELRIREHRAYWESLEYDDAGWMWLRVPEMNEEWRERDGGRYRVLSPQGAYLGDSRWPCYGGRVERGRLLTLVREPASGGPRALVYRILPAVEGLTYP